MEPTTQSTSTPTPEPTTQPTSTAVPPSPTPECQTLGVDIWMPSEYYTEGDKCACSVFVCNPTSETYTNVPLFVILSAYGELYWAPGYSDFDHYTIDLAPGRMEQVVLPEFFWPGGTGEAQGLQWISAMTDEPISQLFGTYDSWTFGWGN
jgi:hypothetical protein